MPAPPVAARALGSRSSRERDRQPTGRGRESSGLWRRGRWRRGRWRRCRSDARCRGGLRRGRGGWCGGRRRPGAGWSRGWGTHRLAGWFVDADPRDGCGSRGRGLVVDRSRLRLRRLGRCTSRRDAGEESEGGNRRCAAHRSRITGRTHSACQVPVPRRSGRLPAADPARAAHARCSRCESDQLGGPSDVRPLVHEAHEAERSTHRGA